MKRNNAWNDEEIQDTVRPYFDLLRDQQKFKPTNKTAIYRKLSSLHPSRSVKAFESKFQNISAVLYEEKMPYAEMDCGQEDIIKLL